MVKITTLLENSIGEHLGLQCEHGLSFFVEANNKKIIFDTGQSRMFMDNAEKLQVDVTKADAVVLSHGHYDHTGGMKPLYNELSKAVPLYVHQDLFVKKFRIENKVQQFLGNDFDETWLKDQNVNVQLVKEDVFELFEDVYLVSNFDRTAENLTDNPLYQVKNGNEYIVDDFHDELSMVVRTNEGLVILLGCSHAGVGNIVSTIKSRIDGDINTIVGGTHLVQATDERIEGAIKLFQKMDIKHVGVSHCTGKKAGAEFESAFKDKYFYNSTGTILEFD